MTRIGNLVGASSLAMVLLSLWSVPPGTVEREELANNIVEAFQFHPEASSAPAGGAERSTTEEARALSLQRKRLQEFYQDYTGAYHRRY